ncbi:MAG: multiple antibiotic resistance protein, partial [Planctomycetota bacterium]
MSELLPTFIVFFAVIDPVGTVPVFIAVTRSHSEQDKRKIALRATAIAASILLFFVVAGEPILTAMKIPLVAFEIAGGIILFLFALSMIFGESKPEEEVKLAREAEETAVFPLAVPSIAGPGAMLAAVLQTENQRFDLMEQIQTTAVMFSVLCVTMLLMLASSRVQRVIGKSGASIISRVMGMILASYAVTSI